MNDSSTKKQTLRTDSVGGSAKFLIWGHEIPNFETPKWRLSVGSVFRGVGFFTKLSTKINQNSKKQTIVQRFQRFGGKIIQLFNDRVVKSSNITLEACSLQSVACGLLLVACWFASYSLWPVACGLQLAACSLQLVACSFQHEACGLHPVDCSSL